MQNPILEMLNAKPPIQSNNSITQIVNLVRNSKNPQQMLQSVAKNNPQLQQIMNLVQSSNMSPRDLFYKMAQQKGVDPNQIINMLK